MKQTKLIATISDLKCEISFLKQAFEAGMDAIRINTAHQAQIGAKRIIKNIRKVSDRIRTVMAKKTDKKTKDKKSKSNNNDRHILKTAYLTQVDRLEGNSNDHGKDSELNSFKGVSYHWHFFIPGV